MKRPDRKDFINPCDGVAYGYDHALDKYADWLEKFIYDNVDADGVRDLEEDAEYWKIAQRYLKK